MKNSSINSKVILKLNGKVTFNLFSDAGVDPTWLCCLEDRHGKEYKITIPESIYRFIKLFDGKKELNEIHKIHLERTSLNSSEWKKFEILVKDFLLVKKILISAEDDDKFSSDLPKTASHLQWQLPVLKSSWVNPLAYCLQFFYQTHFVSILLIFIITAQFGFYLVIEPEFFSLGHLTASEQIQMLLWVGLGLLWHELGHAVAAFCCGCRKVDIGLGWYICFLVFYAELSESWRLTRKQRVIIDGGGMYFQGIFTATLIICQYYTSSAVLFYAIILLNFSFLWNLNPFFRMDGYWLASDILGIANLRQAASDEFSYWLAKCLNQSVKNKRQRLPAKTKNALLAYTLISNVFFCWMAYVIANRLLTTVTVDFEYKVERIINGNFSQALWLDDLVFFGGFIFQLLMISFFCIFLYQASLKVWWLSKKIVEKM